MLCSQCLHRGQQQCPRPGPNALLLEVGASSSGSLLKHFQKGVVKEEFQRGAASCHTSHVGVATGLCRGGRPLLWPPQFPADGEMDDVLRAQTKGGEQRPTRSHQHSQPRHVPLLQEPCPKLLLPAGPYPFSAAWQPHTPQMRAQRWVSFLPLHGTKLVPITPGE